MMGIKIEYSRKLLREHGESIKSQLDTLVSAIPKTLGGAIRDRVSVWGNLAGQSFPGYSAREKGYFTSAKYPDSATGLPTPSGAEQYLSALDWAYAAGVKPGTYNVTGGMWDGLSAVVLSPTYAEIKFRGRSAGRNPRFVKSGDETKSKPIKVDNARKASSVRLTHKVNVLALSPEEVSHTTEATREAVASAVSLGLPVTFTRNPPPYMPVGEIFRQKFGMPRTL